MSNETQLSNEMRELNREELWLLLDALLIAQINTSGKPSEKFEALKVKIGKYLKETIKGEVKDYE